jgi:regulator of replication initiation timing
MAFEIKKTEGGQGGKKGHSNMSHWTGTEEIKKQSNKLRRESGKKEVKETLNENIKEPEELRKERIRLSKTTAEKVVPSKKNPPYDRAKQKDSKEFKGFLESLKGNDQDSLIENFKEGFEACFENDEMTASFVKPFKLFDVTTAPDVVEELKTKINAPHIYPNISKLGGPEHVSILFTVALDPRETWINGILQNSRYMQLSLDNNGVLEHFSGDPGIEKRFRKTRVKSVEDLINKVNSYISLAGQK